MTPDTSPARLGLLIAAARVSGLVKALLAFRVLLTISEAVGGRYQSANAFPTLVFELLASSSLSLALVPMLSRSSTDARLLGSAALNEARRALTVLTIALIALAPWLAHWMAQSDSAVPDWWMVALLVWCIPQLILYGFLAVETSWLFYRGRFVTPAVSPIANNLILIALLGWFWLENRDRAVPSAISIHVLGAGTLAGVGAMAWWVSRDARAHGFSRQRGERLTRDQRKALMVNGSGAAVSGLLNQAMAFAVLTVLRFDDGARVAWSLSWQLGLVAFSVLVAPVLQHGLVAASVDNTADEMTETRMRAFRSIGFSGGIAVGLGLAASRPLAAALSAGFGGSTRSDLTHGIMAALCSVPGLGLAQFAVRDAAARSKTWAVAATTTAIVLAGIGALVLAVDASTPSAVRLAGWVVVATVSLSGCVTSLAFVLRGSRDRRSIRICFTRLGAGLAIGWVVMAITARWSFDAFLPALLASAMLGALFAAAYVVVDRLQSGVAIRATVTSIGGAL